MGSFYNIVYVNIRSISNKMGDLKQLLNKINNSDLTIDVLLVCETFLSMRQLITRGGVAVTIKKSPLNSEKTKIFIYLLRVELNRAL